MVPSFSPNYFPLLLLVALCLIYFANARTMAIPLSGGAEAGEYLMPISVGTPRQDFNVKVTTAEYALMLPSDKCAKRFCKKHFNTSSSTFQKVPCAPACYCPNNANECGYQELFGSNVVRGTVSHDTGSFGNTTMNYTFIRFDQRPPTVTPDSLADGVFGLSLWEPEYEQEQLLPQLTAITQDETFSMCLGEFGGNLILGGVDEQYFTGKMMSVPLIGEQSNFTIELQDLSLAGRSATSPNRINATIDSGTQYLRLPSDIFQTVKLLFHELVCDESGAGHVGICGGSNQTFFENVCYIMDDSTINRFPQIELKFSNAESEPVSLIIPPTNYFVDYGGKACLALDVSPGNHIVIGNRVMQEYYTVFFSRSSKNAVGFAKAVNCSGAQYKAEIVSGNGQRGKVGEKLSKPLVVRVLRLNDSEPVQDVNLTFSVVDTSALSGAMWISHAIGANEPARVSPSFVLTAENGTAQISVWLSGSTYETIISVDIPLCLDHVIFTAIGEQSYVWRIITYLFLGGLVIVVILLNFWYRNAMKRRRLFRSSSSVNNFEFQESYFIGSPPQSPGMAPPRPDFLSDKRRASRDDREDRNDDGDDIEEDEENAFQSASRSWYESISVNSLRWQARRAQRRLRQLFNARGTK